MFAFWNNLSRRALWCEQFLTEVNFRNSLGNQNCAHFLVHPTPGKLEGALLWLMPSMNSWGARRYLGWELGQDRRAVPLGKRSLVTLIMLFKTMVQSEYFVPFMETEKTSWGLCFVLRLKIIFYLLLAQQLFRKSSLGLPVLFDVVIFIVVVLTSSHSLKPKENPSWVSSCLLLTKHPQPIVSGRLEQMFHYWPVLKGILTLFRTLTFFC